MFELILLSTMTVFQVCTGYAPDGVSMPNVMHNAMLGKETIAAGCYECTAFAEVRGKAFVCKNTIPAKCKYCPKTHLVPECKEEAVTHLLGLCDDGVVRWKEKGKEPAR